MIFVIKLMIRKLRSFARYRSLCLNGLEKNRHTTYYNHNDETDARPTNTDQNCTLPRMATNDQESVSFGDVTYRCRQLTE